MKFSRTIWGIGGGAFLLTLCVCGYFFSENSPEKSVVQEAVSVEGTHDISSNATRAPRKGASWAQRNKVERDHSGHRVMSALGEELPLPFEKEKSLVRIATVELNSALLPAGGNEWTLKRGDILEFPLMKDVTYDFHVERVEQGQSGDATTYSLMGKSENGGLYNSTYVVSHGVGRLEILDTENNKNYIVNETEPDSGKYVVKEYDLSLAEPFRDAHAAPKTVKSP